MTTLGPREPRVPRRGTLISAGVTLLVCAAAAWAIGLEWPQAFLVGLSLVALFGFRRLPNTNPGEDWPVGAEEADDRGVRRDVTRLSWTLQGYEFRVEWPSIRRLRAVAVHRLARRGLDLDADVDACRDALGPTAYHVVTADARTHVRIEAFTEALTAVENLTERASR